MTLQFDIFTAQSERDSGIATAVNHANAVTYKWSEAAYTFLKHFLTTTSEPFLVEEVRSYAAELDFPLPPSARAWGGIIARASKEGIVENCGYRKTTNVKAHCTPAALWRAVI